MTLRLNCYKNLFLLTFWDRRSILVKNKPMIEKSSREHGKYRELSIGVKIAGPLFVNGLIRAERTVASRLSNVRRNSYVTGRACHVARAECMQFCIKIGGTARDLYIMSPVL